MGLFGCLWKGEKQPEFAFCEADPVNPGQSVQSAGVRRPANASVEVPKPVKNTEYMRTENSSLAEQSNRRKPAIVFSYNELSAATKCFSTECQLGQGGFGSVYKGYLSGKVVAVKQLDHAGPQGNTEFLVEVLMLNLLHHHNLVNLIGYCSEGDHRLLVYEYMPLGSLDDHLHDLPPEKEPLDWFMRMRIALGTAEGLQYLHEAPKQPVIFRDLKPSNILLGTGYEVKLSDFGLAKLGPVGERTHVTTRVMGTYGYCAPEYASTGKLTLQSDIYSFGVVLLELITGRRALDARQPPQEQDLVEWARPLFKDKKLFPLMVDPLLRGKYPKKGLFQALAIAAMCLQTEAKRRPSIGEIVTALEYISQQENYTNIGASTRSRGSTSTSIKYANHPAHPDGATEGLHGVLSSKWTGSPTVLAPQGQGVTTVAHGTGSDPVGLESQEPPWRSSYRMKRVTPRDYEPSSVIP